MSNESLAERINEFHSQVSIACERMRYIYRYAPNEALVHLDYLGLTADELQRQVDAIDPMIGQLRGLLSSVVVPSSVTPAEVGQSS